MSKFFLNTIGIFIAMSLLLFGLSFNEAKAEKIDTRKLFTKEIANNFDASEDSLCFSNHGFKGHTGYNPYLMILGQIADSRGACQGMVGVASAFKSHVIFRPGKKKMSKTKLRRRIMRAVRLHHNDCQGTIYIDGYSSLKNLCQEESDLLRQRSLSYNVTLAVTEILPKSGTFFWDGPLSHPEKLNRHLLRQLTSIYQDLNKGQYPLMLVHDHVTMVTGMSVERDPQGYIRKLTLKHYDPNVVMSSVQDLFDRTYSFSRDGMEISGTLIWNITPRSLTHLGCLLVPRN